MNNAQFQRLVADAPTRRNDTSSPPSQSSAALGTKKSSFVPMTPRTVKGSAGLDFARQVRERNAALQPTKKFKASAPKGVKYASRYTDRAKAREDEAEEDDKGKRIKALEEQMKLGQISMEMFEALRDEITGGDLSSTHLIKGLDRRLLQRVKRGEDVMGTGNGKAEAPDPPPDVEEELDKLAEKDLAAMKREKNEKKGAMAPPPPVAGVKRSRDQIMAELKAQRKAAAEAKAAATPQLDASRWRKVGDKQKSRVEIDSKGREVIMTVDEDGVAKRKVRKVQTLVASMPETDKAVLGSDAVVPELPLAEKAIDGDDEDNDIFEGVGTEYNPLGAEAASDGDGADDVSSEDDAVAERKPSAAIAKASPDGGISNLEAEMAQPPETATLKASTATPKASTASRNYFNDKASGPVEPQQSHLAGIRDVLKKAAKLDPLPSGSADEGDDGGESKAEREARLKKRTQMLANQDRDLEDMDMGFGYSRGDDEAEEDGEGKKVRLSEWKGGAGNDDVLREDKAGGKKKRRPKKRKGDANNMGDIMRVIEGRKSGGM